MRPGGSVQRVSHESALTLSAQIEFERLRPGLGDGKLRRVVERFQLVGNLLQVILMIRFLQIVGIGRGGHFDPRDISLVRNIPSAKITREMFHGLILTETGEASGVIASSEWSAELSLTSNDLPGEVPCDAICTEEKFEHNPLD
jgi:hypothetical protein